MGPMAISREELLQYDTFLFDADGVLWTGDRAVPGAPEFLKHLLDIGKRVFILTNNSTKTLDQYMAKIARIGYGNIPRSNVISPAVVLAAYLKNNSVYNNAEIYLIGTENLRTTLETEAGVRCFGMGPDPITDYTHEDIMHEVDLAANPRAVVCSYDSHFSYPKLMKAVNFLNRPDVEFLVTNEDLTFPGPNPKVIIPGSGSNAVAVRAVAGKEPTVFGKPHRAMAEYLKKNHKIDSERTVMFGDRLDTDIAFANGNGIASCLVSTGVHSIDDVIKAEAEGHHHLVPRFTHSFA